MQNKNIIGWVIFDNVTLYEFDFIMSKQIPYSHMVNRAVCNNESGEMISTFTMPDNTLIFPSKQKAEEFVTRSNNKNLRVVGILHEPNAVVHPKKPLSRWVIYSPKLNAVHTMHQNPNKPDYTGKWSVCSGNGDILPYTVTLNNIEPQPVVLDSYEKACRELSVCQATMGSFYEGCVVVGLIKKH